MRHILLARGGELIFSMFDFCYERTGAQESKLFVPCVPAFPLAGLWHLSLSKFQRCNNIRI